MEDFVLRDRFYQPGTYGKLSEQQFKCKKCGARTNKEKFHSYCKACFEAFYNGK